MLDEHCRIQRSHWFRFRLQIFACENELVGMNPHAYVPWPDDVGEETHVPLERRVHGWLRQLRLRAARAALLAALLGNVDLAEQVLTLVGW